MRPAATLALVLLPLTACGGDPASEEPAAAATAPALVPRLPELRALAATAPTPPDDERLAELQQWLQVVTHPDQFDERTARRAEEQLDGAEDVLFGLEAGLADEDAAIRSRCAWEIGNRGHLAATPTLLWRLRQEGDPVVHFWVADALVRLGMHSALPDLCRAFADARVAESAAQTAFQVLAEAGRTAPEGVTWDQLTALLDELHAHWLSTGKPLRTPEHALPTLDAWTEARLAGQMVALTEFQLRPVDAARTALGSMGTLPVPLLSRGLDAEERYLRFHVLEILRDLDGPASSLGPEVLPLLEDPLCEVAAIEALARLRTRYALEPLLERLGDPDPEVRTAAAGALGPLGEAAAIPPLRERLRDPQELADCKVRAAYSLALLEHGGEGEEYLRRLKEEGAYHEATLDELLDALAVPQTDG